MADRNEESAKLALANLVARFPELEPSKWGIPDDTPRAAIIGVAEVVSRLLLDNLKIAKALGAEHGDFEFRYDGNVVGLFGLASRIVILQKKVFKEIRSGAKVDYRTARILVKWLVAAALFETTLIPSFCCLGGGRPSVRLRFEAPVSSS